MGLGGFPEDHHLSLGMLGMHGTAYANFAVTESDVLVAIGARFDDRITGKIDEFAPHAKIIHVDIDPASISKSIRVDIPVVGDAKNILQELNKHIHFVERKEWLDKIKHWKEKNPLSYNNSGNVIKPQYVIEQICDAAKGNAIITTEAGQNQMWAAQYFTFTQPRTFLSVRCNAFRLFEELAVAYFLPGLVKVIEGDIAGDGS